MKGSNCAHETLTSSLCVIMFLLTSGSGMTTVSPIRTPQLFAVLYTITRMHVSSLSTIPNVLQKKRGKKGGGQKSRFFWNIWTSHSTVITCNSQCNTALGRQAKHHFAQGSDPNIVAVFEGGQCSRLQAASAARWGTEVRCRTRTQSRCAEVREHRT